MAYHLGTGRIEDENLVVLSPYHQQLMASSASVSFFSVSMHVTTVCCLCSNPSTSHVRKSEQAGGEQSS